MAGIAGNRSFDPRSTSQGRGREDERGRATGQKLMVVGAGNLDADQRNWRRQRQDEECLTLQRFVGGCRVRAGQEAEGTELFLRATIRAVVAKQLARHRRDGERKRDRQQHEQSEQG